jgi:hypothetical protein
MVSSYTAYLAADRNYVKTLKAMSASGPVQRDLEYFVENIGKVSTGDQLVDDPKLYRFVMTAFDLESQIFAKGLIRKIFKEGIQDPLSLANRMTDNKFKTMAKAFAFAEVGDYNVNKPEFVTAIVKKYLEVKIEAKAGEENVAVRLGLYFDRAAPNVSNWYAVLADRALREVVRVGLGLPQAMNSAGPDQLVKILEDRYDIADFKDAEKRDKLIKKFTLLYDLENGVSGPDMGRVALFNPINPSGGRGQIITIDPSTLGAITRFS